MWDLKLLDALLSVGNFSFKLVIHETARLQYVGGVWLMFE